MAPSFVVILLGLEPSRTLAISQVVLSFGLPFAIVPLVVFTEQPGGHGAAGQWQAHHSRGKRRGGVDRGPQRVSPGAYHSWGERPCFGTCWFPWTAPG